jgi:hypothetical protein
MSLDLRIEKLRRDHPIEGFDCGKSALNRFLERHALQSQQAGATTTYLALHDDEVAGFYSLSVGQIEYADAPERLIKGLARHPVPVMLLARMAVATAYQGQRLGAAQRRTTAHLPLGALPLAVLKRHHGFQQARRVGGAAQQVPRLLIGGEILQRHQHRGGLAVVAGDDHGLEVGGHRVERGGQIPA